MRLAAECDVIGVAGYRIGSVAAFRRDDIAGYVDRRVLDLPQVIISAGPPDSRLAPAGMVAAMAAQVAGLCEDE